MSGRTCLVTGGSSGIGKETAAQLASQGATVIIVGRDPARTALAGEQISRRSPAGRVEPITADLSELAQVRELAKQVQSRYERLHVLVHNAGVIMTRRRLTADGFETTFAVNHLAPFLLTHLLRGLLERSAPARVVTVASAVHKQVRAIPWDDLAGGAPQPYAVSKLLNVLFTVALAERLAGTGVTANCLHPGVVRTNLGRDVTGGFGLLLRLALPLLPGPATGAATPVYLASAPEVAAVTGGYFVKCRPAEPSRLARDRPAAERLWTLSEQLAGLTG